MAITGLSNSGRLGGLGGSGGSGGGSGFTESQIKEIILTDLRTPGSELYSECEYIADQIDVVRKVEEALPSTYGYSIVNQISEMCEAIAVSSIETALDGNGDGLIHQAIENTMLAPDGSGIIYNAMDTFVVNAIDSYANNIGVGGTGTAFYTVYEAADDVITSQLSLGGTIDSAIKAGGA